MKRTCMLLTVMLLLSSSAGAQEFGIRSASTMLQHCKNFLGIDANRINMVEGMCAGRIIALDDLRNVLPQPWCPPREVSIAQMIRVVVNYLETRPAPLHENFTHIAMEALKITWPCPSK